MTNYKPSGANFFFFLSFKGINNEYKMDKLNVKTNFQESN